MTLGEKIKFARQLRGMTQKELGLRVGFSESTADNRIRQYEMGKMKPKEDKLELIAEALEVDVDALTDIDLGTYAGNKLPHLLFEMERNDGLTIHKIGNQFMMSFDPAHQTGEFYNEALSSWYYARKKYIDAASEDSEEALRKYHLWTLEFPFNVIAEEEAVSKQVKEMYAELVESEENNVKLNTVSDLIHIFKDMSFAKIDYIINENKLFTGWIEQCTRVRISHKVLLELEPASQTAYARFCVAIKKLLELGQDIVIQTNGYDNISYDDYNIISSAITPALLGTVNDMKKHIENETFNDPDYQIEYQADLKQFNVPITEAIHRPYGSN